MGMTDVATAHGPVHRFRSVLRLLAAGLVAVLGMSVLSACTAQGDAAARWFSSHDIVESVDTGGSYSGFTHNPSVDAVITSDATSDQIRQLALDATAYRVEHNSPGLLHLSIEQHGVTLAIGQTVESTIAAFDSWDVIRAGQRVSPALVYDDKILLWGSRADLVDLAVDYADVPQELRVNFNNGGGLNFELENCGLDADGATFAKALLDEGAVVAARISLCSRVVLATSSPDDMIALATRVRGLSENSGIQVPDIRVVYDSTVQFLFQSSPLWEISLAHVNEQSERLLSRVYEASFTGAARLDPDGRLHIVTTKVMPFRDVVEAVFSDPDISSVTSVRITGGLPGGGVVLEARELDEAVLDLALAEQLIHEDSIHYIRVTPVEIVVTMPEETLTAANGRAAIDLIVASGLWADRTVSIKETYGTNGLVVVSGVPQAVDNGIGTELDAYWRTILPTP